MKRKTGIRFLAVFLILILCLPGIVSCGKKETRTAEELSDCKIQHEEEFGGVYICLTIDEFNSKGYEYGDSLNITFSNGYVLKDVPYYNGYYTANGEPLLVAYPGYPYIKAGINNGEDLYEIANLKKTKEEIAKQSLFAAAALAQSDTASITLNEAGKYKDIQNARDIHYKDDRSLFDSDEVFANFRYVQAGKIAEKTLYRSASPCDNQHNRAPYVDALAEKAGIGFILNLSDTDTKIEKYMDSDDFNSPYFASLYEELKVVPIALNMNYGSQAFKEKIVGGLNVMAESEGPYLVHCTEGKDRTGFVCMLLEALAGAEYDEIVKDYMITYDNYYKINAAKEKDKYEIIIKNVLDPMILSLAKGNETDVQKVDLKTCAMDYLTEGGMSPEIIDKLITRLTGE